MKKAIITGITGQDGVYLAKLLLTLVGDLSKAKDILGWSAKCSLEELCAMMVKEDLKRNENSDSP